MQEEAATTLFLQTHTIQMVSAYKFDFRLFI
jgi:hypothetical protein